MGGYALLFIDYMGNAGSVCWKMGCFKLSSFIPSFTTICRYDSMTNASEPTSYNITGADYTIQTTTWSG